MDFDRAAQRLKQDHSKIQRRKPVTISAQARLQAEKAKKQRALLAAKREKERRQKEYAIEFFRQQDRRLGVKQLSTRGPLQFKATSVHGEGDKITLPPSVLEYMTAGDSLFQSPWIFRIGILNPEYEFPMSSGLKTMVPNDPDGMETDDDEDTDETSARIYRDELSHKYLAYTHGTVIEFTQEEGYIGLPEPVAISLLRKKSITSTRTVDPASKVDNINGEMEVDENTDAAPKTAGHLAYGAFDVPDLPIEVTWIQKMPKGEACELTPTRKAIEAGFYSLKDIKLMLEQSLIRSRATLSVGDEVATWHRGIKYDLQVTAVTPSTYNTIICINTDLEVEFGKVETAEESPMEEIPIEPEDKVSGQRLGHTLGSATATTVQPSAPVAFQDGGDLPPEPPQNQKENVCLVQIRAPNGATGKRRFDISKSSVNDLMVYASSLGMNGEPFRLVTRFPRRVFEMSEEPVSLQKAGLEKGQEVFLVERL